MAIPQPVRLEVFALCTYQDILEEVQIATGSQMAGPLTKLANRYSAIIEERAGCHLVWRGAGSIVEEESTVARVLLANGAQTLVAQPADPGRALRIVITDADGGISAGRVVVVGVTTEGEHKTEVYDVQKCGLYWESTTVWKTLTSITAVGFTGNASGDMIEVGTRIPYTDYHSLRKEGRGWVRSSEAPIGTTVDLYEDTLRTYSNPSDLLELDEDYVVNKKNGKITRLSGGTEIDFYTGLRVLRHRYSAGFPDDAFKSRIPWSLRSMVAQSCAFHYREIENKNQGISNRSDLSDAVTRFAAQVLTGAHLTKDIQRMIDQTYLRRRSYSVEYDEDRGSGSGSY